MSSYETPDHHSTKELSDFSLLFKEKKVFNPLPRLPKPNEKVFDSSTRWPVATAPRRLFFELEEIHKDPPDNNSAGLVANDIFHWQATILGPSNTPYEYGVFRLTVRFPSDYPFKPPVKTKIFHPNINQTGTIRPTMSDTNNWNPAFSVSKVLLTIYALLADPSLHDSLMPDIAYMYKMERGKYESIARDWTRKYAMG